MAGTNFNNLISSLHSSLSDQTILNDNKNTNVLIVDANRQITAGEGFNTTIAYEGDINSQLITIQCVAKHDNHDLSGCTSHQLKWKNLSSGAEGVSNLLTNTVEGDNFAMTWEVPAEACTSAGTIEISITISDISEGRVVFSWNTAKYTGLIVGGSMESVGFDFPAKDEILVIDRDTKNITAPIGYNNVICNYGEKGLSKVYFLINKYIGKNRKFDIYNQETDNVTVSLYIAMTGEDETVRYAIDSTNISK
jgi:hypothetical protein